MTHSTTSKLVLPALLLFLSWSLHVVAEDNPDVSEGNTANTVHYNGMTYDQALAEFQSDLSPLVRIRSLEALVQFAIHDYRQEEVASLLVKESRTIPWDFFGGMYSGDSSERILASFLERAGKSMSRSTDELISGTVFSPDEMRYWIRITSGVYRLAESQRNVFEQAMHDSTLPLGSRFLARIAVQEADVRAAAIHELLDLLSPKPKSNAAVRIDNVISAPNKESALLKP